MDPFAWPLVVVVLGFAALIGFRKSLSKILGGIIKVIEGIKLRKAAGLEFDPIPQQQIEEAKIDAKLTPANSAQDQSETNDPVLGPRIQAFRRELDGRSSDPIEREKVLLHVAAVWHVNHENARIARNIFGSQLEILLHLNSRPDGDTWRISEASMIGQCKTSRKLTSLIPSRRT